MLVSYQNRNCIPYCPSGANFFTFTVFADFVPGLSERIGQSVLHSRWQTEAQGDALKDSAWARYPASQASSSPQRLPGKGLGSS